MMNNLQKIFREVFDDDSLVILETTTAQDIDDWDSLAHIRLIVAIEKYYRIHFSAFDISSVTNVGEMVRLIQKKISDV
jgi:acyl carrier protein